MGVYQRYALPRLTELACGSRPTMRQREKVVPLARGEVLEIGVGTGLNLGYYDPHRVTRLYGLDPSPAMLARAERRTHGLGTDVTLLEGAAERIPLADHAVDTVVVTYSLCTIPDLTAALAELRRVLRAGGSLVFCEHGAAPDPDVRKWQDRLTPLWKRIGGGCHLNREIPGLLEAGGFRIGHLETMYLPGWRPACFNYWGVARLPDADVRPAALNPSRMRPTGAGSR